MTELIQKLSAKCWNERKEALVKIDSRLRSGTCSQLEASEFVDAVIKVLATDKHLKLVATAANVIARAADTMKHDFAPFAKPALQSCLSGFRTNKPFAIAALRTAADSTFNTLSVEAIADSVLGSLTDKASNPSMNEEAMKLLGRALHAFKGTGPITSRRTLFRRLLTPLITSMENRCDAVRDAACHTLACARCFLADDSTYTRLTLDAVDDSKKSRLDLAYQGLSNVVKKVERPPKDEAVMSGGRMQVVSLDKANGKRCPSVSSGAPQPPQSKKAKMTSRPASAQSATFAIEQHISDDEIKRILVQGSIYEDTINKLSSTNWRERLESIDLLYSHISSLPFDSPAFSQSLIRLLSQTPGFNESNLQVRTRLLETIASILEYSETPFLCESLFESLTTKLIGLMCNPKCLSSCEACLNGLEKCCGLPVLGNILLRLVASTKVSKSAGNTLLWLTRAVERSSGFCLNYPLTVKHLKEGFNSNAGQVRHAYVKLAGAVYASLSGDGSCSVGGPSPVTFQAELEGSSKSTIKALLLDEFQARKDAAKAIKCASPRGTGKHTFTPALHSLSCSTHRTPEGISRRMATILYSPPMCHSMEETFSGNDEMNDEAKDELEGNFALDDHSPLGLSSTFCAVSVPLLVADFKAKKTRLALLATGTLHPPRQRLEADFLDAGMHPNLRRLLTSWDLNPAKTKEALVLLTHLLLQHTPSRQMAAQHQQDLLSDTLANSDLIFQWMAESCFATESLDPAVVSQALEYLEELVSRLADARLTLTPAEVRILLPWPLFAPHMLDRYFSQASERCRRLTGFLFSLCRVLSADEIYATVMDAVSTLTETVILKELLLLVKLLLTRFAGLPNPSVADIKAIAQHIGSSDKEVHQVALGCLKAARGTYSTEQISAMAGKLTERDRAFLEDVLNQDASTLSLQTPLRLKAPRFDVGFSASYTNNPSILASVTRSQLAHCSNLMGWEDEESHLRAPRQWILDVLAEDDRIKEARMVTFLISKLLITSSPLPSSCSTDCAEHLDAALLSISHLDFLHQSTATRDLLLPEASTLVEHLGLQMSQIALGRVSTFDYTTEDVCRFVRVTVGFVISIFRAAFLTRDLKDYSLAQLLAGLLRLHTVFDRICQGRFEAISLKDSLLLLLLDLDIARSLEEELLLTLEFVHEKLVANDIFTYIIGLTNLINGRWSSIEATESDSGENCLVRNNLLLHMLNLATKEMFAKQGSHRGDVNTVLKALEESRSFEQQSDLNEGSLMIAFVLNRLRY